MSKIEFIQPIWWLKYKKVILQEHKQKIFKAQLEYEKKSYANKTTWKQYQYKQNQIELARLMQNTKSASELMRLNGDRTELILTFTMSSPHIITNSN